MVAAAEGGRGKVMDVCRGRVVEGKEREGEGG